MAPGLHADSLRAGSARARLLGRRGRVELLRAPDRHSACTFCKTLLCLGLRNHALWEELASQHHRQTCIAVTHHAAAVVTRDLEHARLLCRWRDRSKGIAAESRTHWHSPAEIFTPISLRLRPSRRSDSAPAFVAERISLCIAFQSDRRRLPARRLRFCTSLEPAVRCAGAVVVRGKGARN